MRSGDPSQFDRRSIGKELKGRNVHCRSSIRRGPRGSRHKVHLNADLAPFAIGFALDAREWSARRRQKGPGNPSCVAAGRRRAFFGWAAMVGAVEDRSWRRGFCCDHGRRRALLGLSLATGGLVAALAMIGDLFSSFVKRRLKFPSSSQAIGLDRCRNPCCRCWCAGKRFR